MELKKGVQRKGVVEEWSSTMGVGEGEQVRSPEAGGVSGYDHAQSCGAESGESRGPQNGRHQEGLAGQESLLDPV